MTAKKYSVGEMFENIIAIVAFIVLVSMVSLYLERDVEKESVFAEGWVDVQSVPNGGTVKVFFNNEIYEVQLPVEAYTEKQSEFAKGLMEDGAIQLKNYWIDREEKQIYPENVYVDGEDVIALLYAQEPKLFGYYK